MSRYIHHITLTTGHTRRSWRHEIAPDIMPALIGLVDAAREDGGVALPGIVPACRLAITDTARCALCSVRTAAGAPVVTFAVARHGRCGAQLWRMLIETASRPCAVGVAERPRAPWCAARLEGGLILLPQQSVEALGDLERCVAWAWINLTEARRENHVYRRQIRNSR